MLYITNSPEKRFILFQFKTPFCTSLDQPDTLNSFHSRNRSVSSQCNLLSNNKQVTVLSVHPQRKLSFCHHQWAQFCIPSAPRTPTSFQACVWEVQGTFVFPKMTVKSIYPILETNLPVAYRRSKVYFLYIASQPHFQ